MTAEQAGNAPFRLTPDLRYLFMSPAHAAAAAALDAAIDSGSRLIALVGEPGTGKTTLLSGLRAQQDRPGTTMVYCPYPALSLAALLGDLLVPLETAAEVRESPDIRMIAARIAEGRAGQRLILIVDDAARSSPCLMADLWRTAELAAGKSFRLQIILATDHTACLDLDRELTAAGIAATTKIELSPMGTTEVGNYIRHRLRIAGLPEGLFAADAVADVARHSQGIARVVNQICSRAIMLSDLHRQRPIAAALIAEAVEDCPIDALVAAHAMLDLRPAAAAPATPVPIQLARAPEIVSAPPMLDDIPAAAPNPAAVEAQPEAPSDIDVPSLPSQRPTPEREDARKPAAGTDDATLPRLPLRSRARPSWQLREIARERRLVQGNSVAPRTHDQSAPRYAGFVARKPLPAAKTEPPVPPAARPRRSALAVVIAIVVLAGAAGATILLRPELPSRVAELLAPMRQELARAATEPRAALDRLRELIRPAYDLERPPRS